MPLDDFYEAWRESISDHESVEDYIKRVRPECLEAERHFFSHVLYDHFGNFVGRFPWFDLSHSVCEYREVSALWVQSNVRCEHDLSQWDHFYDGTPSMMNELPELMRQAGSWPIAPVIFQIEDATLLDAEVELPLYPFHLIEGTHRINYLNRMLTDGTIPPESLHRLLIVKASA